MVAVTFLGSNRATRAGDEAVEDRALLDIGGPKIAKVVPADALPTPTNEVIVQLLPGSNARAVAADNGLVLVHRLKSDRDLWVMRALTPDALAAAAFITGRDARVLGAYPNDLSAAKRMAFVPNDPFFHKNTPVFGWPGQWHLINEHVAKRDVNIKGCWNNDKTGLGVTIGIVDDCLQHAHPDLAPNYKAADSWDFEQGDADPSPLYASDEHGIAVAGVAAARGGNGIGVTGAAPRAGLAGMRVGFGTGPASQFLDAILYHSSGGNTNVKVKNHSYGYNAPYIVTAAESAAVQASLTFGTIHCFSAGNSRGGTAQDSNKLDYTNERGAICVAAMGSDGKFAYYSNFGACVAVTAPSSSSAGLFGKTTTDRTGALGYNPTYDTFPDTDYTTVFGGTSSSSPLVAGVMAVIKQSQPLLTSRMAKHILSKTCTIVDPTDATVSSDGGWVTNAAGRKFNQNYGFGLINANNMRLMAKELTGITALTEPSTGNVIDGATIPDNSVVGLDRTISAASYTVPCEEIKVRLKVTHTWRGDIRAVLTSPSGTTSRLIINSNGDSANNFDFEFTSNAFWGESINGTWTLHVEDIVGLDIGTLDSWSFTACLGNYTFGLPNKAAGLVKTGATPASVSLAWKEKSFVEDNVQVWRKLTTSGVWTLKATLPPDTIAYTDLTAVHLKKYNYKIININGVGSSPDSNIIVVTVP